MNIREKYIRLIQNRRLYKCPIPLIGLSGGIACGKSSVTLLMEKRGLTVISADKLVKKLYEKDEAFRFVKNLVPSSIKDNYVHFQTLRKKIFDDDSLRKRLESFLHPQLEELFLASLEKTNSTSVIYDVPLLFEKNLHEKTDLSLCIFCTRQQQKQRLQTRDGINSFLCRQMIDSQLPLEEKKEKADFVVDNTKTLEDLKGNVEAWMDEVFTKTR